MRPLLHQVRVPSVPRRVRPWPLGTAATNQPPVWAAFGSVVGYLGTPATFALPVADPDGDPLDLTSIGTALPSGWLLNSALRRLEWSGSGAVGTTTGHVIRATEVISAEDITTFGLNSASNGNADYAFGHAFKAGDVPSGEYVTSAGTFQCSPLTYWPDGSLKHAIIAGRLPVTTGANSITLQSTSNAPTGSALTDAALGSGTSIVISAGAFNWNLNASAGTADLVRTVCSGPVMSNFIYRKPVSGHNHLVLWADVRVFASGRIEVFPWVENGYLLVASPTNDVRTYTVTIGGSSVFSQSLDVKHHTRIPLMTGSTLSYWTGTNPQIMPAHNMAYLRSTKLVTNNRRVPGNTVLANTSEHPQTYTPNWLGTTKSGMAATGYGNHIGPFPNWQASYIASGDVRAYRATIVNGMAAGSWPMHFRNEATNEPIKYGSFPNVSVSWSGSPTVPAGSGGNNADGDGQASPDRAHQPSLAYLPWLLTGRWFFLDEQLFWVTWCYLYESNHVTREGAKGLLFDGQVRSRAWHARSHAQLLALLPQSHPCFPDIQYTWEQNCAAYEARYVTGTRDSGAWVNNLGCMGLYSATGTSAYGTAGGYWWDAPWMQDMMAVAFGMAWDMQVPQSASSLASHQAVRDFAYKHSVGLAGGSGATEHSYLYFGEFETPYGSDSTGSPPETWFANWGASLAARKVYGNGSGSTGTLPNLTYAEPGTVYYGPNAVAADYWAWHSAVAFHLGALSLAVDHGAPGAAAAWARVTGATNFSTVGFDTYSIWSFVPRA